MCLLKITGIVQNGKISYMKCCFSTSSKRHNKDGPVIPLKEARRFMIDCMKAVGAPQTNAEAMGDILIEADYRGHYSHGMNRLAMYINEVMVGSCDAKAIPKVIKESPATALVDGRNGLGAVVGKFCMDQAVKKAKKIGCGWVVAKGSNHYGLASMYTVQAVKQGVLGFTCTNTAPLMVPTRAKEAVLGTNPFSLAAPGKNNDSFVLDMATTAVALGKVEIARRKGIRLPEGWALNAQGQPEHDPEKAVKDIRLMPLGGTEANSGYKGTGLAMLVEVFCGILSGSDYGPYIKDWNSKEKKPSNLGHCFFAVDPKFFAPGFEDRLADFLQLMRKLEPADPKKPVLVAGDMEKKHMKQVDKVGGVKYVRDQLEQCAKLAKQLKVKPLKC